MISEYSKELFLLSIFFMLTYAVVEVIKNFIVSMPDKLGNIFKVGLNKKATKWLSFLTAYWLSFMFDFQFANMIFTNVNGDCATLHQHINYFINACLLFVGSKWIHKKIKATYKGLINDESN